MVSSRDITPSRPRRSPVGARLNGGRTVLLAAFLTPFLAAGLLVACSGEPQSLASYIAAICSTRFRSAPAAEAPYLAENVGAMTKMMIDMGIRPSGDVDADFVAMMVPHHQGAIEMARAELRYGHNEQLKRMAQEIIVTQLQEIAAMHLVLSQPLPARQGDRTVAGEAYAQGGDFK
jgi:predicted regulator of Ras-like GTPase activity (Roadblock/LC7/MglB family)